MGSLTNNRLVLLKNQCVLYERISLDTYIIKMLIIFARTLKIL